MSVGISLTSIVSSHFPFVDDFCAFGPKEDISDHKFTRFVLFQLCELVRPLLLTSSLFPGFPDQTNL